jgi:hypothetical protein
MGISDVPRSTIEVRAPDVGTYFKRGRLRVFGRVRQGFGSRRVDNGVEFHWDRTTAGSSPRLDRVAG